MLSPVLQKFLPPVLLSMTLLALAACGKQEAPAPVEPVAEPTEEVAPPMAEAPSLAAILEAQPDEVKARYAYRHPQQTLEFFGIEPGMTVIEVLPTGGWYTNILVPFLGADGTLIGVDYSPTMFPLFGFYSEERLAAKATWPEDWVAETRALDLGGADVAAFQFGAMPETMAGSADAVLFIRALHNLARFEGQGGFLTAAIADAYTALRPGGIVGVVQHKAPEQSSDEWASGGNGYLKQSMVIKRFEAAGFQLIDASNVNVNPLDEPTEDDLVWRLPPNLMTTRDNPEAAQAYIDIGESTRMTLKFRKPL